MFNPPCSFPPYTPMVCESCRQRCMSRVYDPDTGFLSCGACLTSEGEVQVSDNALCTLHNRSMYVIHDGDRTPRYTLFLTSNNEEIGEAMTLDGIIRIADAYKEGLSA